MSLSIFRKPEPVVSKVAGEDVSFYPVSIGCLLKLKEVAKPLGAALSGLFQDTKSDTGQSHDTLFDAGQVATSKSEVEAISVDLAKFRQGVREKAISDLTDFIFSSGSQNLLYSIVQSSLGDEGKSLPKESEFFASVDTVTFVELLKGAFKANKKVLGPFSESLQSLIRQKVEAAKAESLQGQETSGNS